MVYHNMLQGVFLDRPNRFIAEILLEGRREICHVKNTGRCKELLVPGAEIWVQDSFSPSRKTRYDLISVRKGDRLINMDAAAPNRVFGEYLQSGRGPVPVTSMKPEFTFGQSRFDFYLEAPGRRILAEVKGVTLEEDGVVRFPDAPTIRGVKHLYGLMDAVDQGFEAWVVFIVQMRHVSHFEPNRKTHPAFADALAEAAHRGVKILALDCQVTETSITAADPVAMRL